MNHWIIKVGDLCRVIKNGHDKPQLGDLVVVTQICGGSGFYVEGINTKTGNRHHYLKRNLEIL